MFGQRNGAARSQAASAPQKQSTCRPTEADSITTPIRWRTSSESISSIDSNNVQAKASAASHQFQHSFTHRINGQNHQQTNSTANKELNIQVVVRIRSRNEREVRENSPIAVQAQNKEILVPSTLGDRAPSKSYSFDRVFLYSDQECIYSEVVTPILEEVLTGYNCTIFAYGQTGTGKTFTMEGDLRDNFGECSRDAGIIPRTLYSLFAALENKDTEFSVRVSFLELYNEEVKDLLAPDDDRKVVKIFDNIKKQGPLIQGLEEVSVFTPAQGIDALRKGSAKRTVASTKSNDKSSRSHGVFSITVHVKEATDDGEELLKIGKLNLVDLAGSENIARSGAEAIQAKEAGRINQSLLTLGRVINSLVERSQHIPYRESKLTRLLEDSLGGKTKTCIIATISPAKSCLEETISTLNYANRAKNIKNTPEVNQKMSKKTLIKEYLLEIDRLKADLNATREKNGVFMTQESYQALLDENTSNKDLVGETQKQADMVAKELARIEEKYRENMKALSATELKLSISKSELKSKRIELQEVQNELTKTKQVLEEEVILHQAHAHTENELNTVAAELRATIIESVKDIDDLYKALDRKDVIEHENQLALKGFQKKLIGLSGELKERVQSFGIGQVDLLASVKCKVDKASQDTVAEAESMQSFLSVQMERISNAVESFDAQENSMLEKVQALKQEFVTLRSEVIEFLSSRIEILKLNAQEGFEDLKKTFIEFTEFVEQHQEVTKRQALKVIDDSTRLSKESFEAHQHALDKYDKVTRSEIEHMMLQNRALRQQLKEQEAAKDEIKRHLLTKIGDLVDEFLDSQANTLMGYFSNTHNKLEDSALRLADTHSQQRTWLTEFERTGIKNIQALTDSRSALGQESDKAMSRITDNKHEFVAQAHALGSHIRSDLQSQQATVQTRMLDVGTRVLKGYDELQSQRAATAKVFSQTSDHTIAALQDLKTRTSTSTTNAESVYNTTSREVVTAIEQLQKFRENANQSLGTTQKETEELVLHKFKVDNSRERTPARREYQYPRTWGRTRPSQELLKEFRELGCVKTYTTDQGTYPKGLSDLGNNIMTSFVQDQGPRNVYASQIAGPEVDATSKTSTTDNDSYVHVMKTIHSTGIQTKSPSKSSSQSPFGQEIEKEDNTSTQLTTVNQGSYMKRDSTSLSHVVTGVQAIRVKRSASDMDNECGDETISHHTDDKNNNLNDIDNSAQASSAGLLKTQTISNQKDPLFSDVDTTAHFIPVVAATSGVAGFGMGKSGLMNGVEGPRKVSRSMAGGKPVRRGFLSGNNRS
ncbi:kinesin motor protein cin8 [Lobosporangium transversale]|uniref:Kinesin motor domain-containing protein n=1 Tax=Lobosporangium transversale TaxID=64571 RepID=A0A1Y2GLV6_9FUNG|nr:hypothetical protein BCR41DRAFT_322970 [Lobosporangium transversale]KAF9919039.1 kinesin motor protein cin8 [Lobosporangium transversale]ORZ14831.1 hypothetical protein BCR41DRAFT_322970 [Lobosporangium transversale]|eukprot:XP_021880963.1 hypothetical protein BCR41DRAFT_322970 [Lobosporangium transversale]